MARSMSDHPELEPFGLALSVSHLLHRAEQLASDRFAHLVSNNISLRQFAVLAAIAEQPGLSQNDLVRATGVDRSTLADMMTRMQKRGWIERTISVVDARAHSVHLTGAGSSILAGYTQHARAADAAILDLLPRAKQKSLLNTLTKLAKEAQEKLEKDERDARRSAKRERKAKAKTKLKPKPKPKTRTTRG
jgi:DNA-binding MarR family transcriptional regulator